MTPFTSFPSSFRRSNKLCTMTKSATSHFSTDKFTRSDTLCSRDQISKESADGFPDLDRSKISVAPSSISWNAVCNPSPPVPPATTKTPPARLGPDTSTTEFWRPSPPRLCLQFSKCEAWLSTTTPFEDTRTSHDLSALLVDPRTKSPILHSVTPSPISVQTPENPCSKLPEDVLQKTRTTICRHPARGLIWTLLEHDPRAGWASGRVLRPSSPENTCPSLLTRHSPTSS